MFRGPTSPPNPHQFVPTIKHIALIEWNWAGHHPTYFKQYLKTLLSLGHTVLAACPEPEEVSNWLAAEHRRGRDQTDSRNPAVELIRFTRPPTPAVYPRRFRAPALACRLVLELRSLLNRWERSRGSNIDLVFFSCIYDDDFRHFHVASTLFPWRWSGLYLHCRALRLPGTAVPQTGQLPRPDIIFAHPNLDSVAILDEGVRDTFASAIAPAASQVVTFPDFCDESTTPNPTALERKIRHAAADRPVVGSLGHLQSTKGTADLAQIALDDKNADLFFLFAGNFVRVHFTPGEIDTIESAALERENTLALFQQIPDGIAFNATIQACDVLYAAYRDFPNSSNILTKAAVFEKPVIVSDGHLMAERVRAFHLGEVIPEGDLAAATRAIRNITADIPAWIERNRPRWQDYRSLHSVTQLKSAFASLLSNERNSPRVPTPKP